MIKFSIITVVRNDCIGVVRTMQSVILQTYQEFEFIVQDGASTDGTSDVLRSFGGMIDSLVVGDDDGIYDAMNKALMRASGEYLLFMNSSDYFANLRVLENVAELINPEEDDIFVGQAFREEDGKLHPYRPKSEFWAGSTCDHQASFIRREVMQRLKYDTKYRIAGDLHFFTRAKQEGLRFRHQQIPIVRKPFGEGASVDFVARIRDRLGMLERAWGDKYPVRDKIERELRGYVSKNFGIGGNHLRDMSIEKMLDSIPEWIKITNPIVKHDTD